MTAWVRDITIEQGASFPLGFVLYELTYDGDGEVVVDGEGNPVLGAARNLTGCKGRMMIRKKIADATPLMSVNSDDPGDNPEEGGRVVFQAGNVAGRVDIMLTDLDTDKVNVTAGFYDFEIEYPQVEGEIRPFVERVLQGAVVCKLNVTR